MMVIALASPIPLNFLSLVKDNLLNSFKLELTACKILLHKSTADSSRVPEPMRIANSSASDKAACPLSIIFSRGLSSSAHCLIENYFSAKSFIAFLLMNLRNIRKNSKQFILPFENLNAKQNKPVQGFYARPAPTYLPSSPNDTARVV